MNDKNDSKDIISERFGRYLLLDHLADGGMAKICRARTLGEQVDKIVTIKMIQPQFLKDESFKTMFLDEIKVTFGLNHPNIAQTFDYGEIDKQLYTAMEYVDGKNLKEYLEKLRDQKYVFPVEITVYIISQVCQGLYYAHTYTDKLTGKAAHIIHRDISPHNIMLTYDGTVKLIDFGIAKSVTNTDATQTGMIKGKLSYIAPEYLEGTQLDPRYDQFALGITLWEMLCCRKLFVAPNDIAILKQIQKCKIPAPSSINPNVPKELDEIVLKALSKNRKDRYVDLDKLNRSLVKFLYSSYPDFNASDLSHFAEKLFKEDIQKDRKKMFEFGKIDLQPFLNNLKDKKETLPGNGEDKKDSSLNDESFTRKTHVTYEFDFNKDNDEKVKKKKENNLVEKESRPRRNLNEPPSFNNEAKKINKKKEDVFTIGEKEGEKIKRKKEIEHRITRERSYGSISRDIEISKSGFNIKTVLIVIVIILGGYLMYEESSKTLSKKKNIKSSNEGKNKVVKGIIEIENSSVFDQKVYLNGKDVTVSVLGEIEIDLNKEVVLRVVKPGSEYFVKRIFLDSSNKRIKLRIPSLKQIDFGYLVTSRSCLKGTLHFSLFREKRVEELPIKNYRGIGFPIYKDGLRNSIPKRYNLIYKLSGEEIERKISFVVKNPDDQIDLCDHI